MAITTYSKTTKSVINDYDLAYMFNPDSKYPFTEYGCECADGWEDLIISTLKIVAKKDPNKECQINQIKEKFGGLRIYVEFAQDSDMDEIWQILDQAEKQSFVICEDCGSTDQVTTDYISEDIPYIRTLCISCRKKEIDHAND